MDYQEVMQYIEKTKKIGMKLGLDKPRRLMELLGNPQDSLSFVHIAGTNGKGSTAAFLTEILIRSGYKTGLYTSPFLYEFNERIRINGKNISDEALGRVMQRVKQAADQMEAQGEEYPTEFEVVTAAAFCYFAEEKCDLVVLEVGMGGRFDATNIIKAPLLSIITSISLDHTQYLGNTIEEIAFEKCGIVKEGGRTLVSCRQDPKALAVIECVAKERKNCLTVCRAEDLSDCLSTEEGNQFLFQSVPYRTAQRGDYQIDNAATAITAAQILKEIGWQISASAICEGIANAKWAGRLETLSEHPLVIVDGAHNPDGMRAFVRAVQNMYSGRKKVCLVAMLKDKDCAACLFELAKAVQTVVFTTVDNPRAAQAEELAGFAAGLFDKMEICAGNDTALAKAVQLAGKEGVVFAVGSLYFIHAVREGLDKRKSGIENH